MDWLKRVLFEQGAGHIDAALAKIEKGKGILFDRAAVDTCIAPFREGAYHFD